MSPLVDPALLEILCCPRCKGALDPNEQAMTLVCRNCGGVYQVKDGIPIMLTEETDGQ